MQLAPTRRLWIVAAAVAILAAVAVASGTLWQGQRRADKIATAMTGGDIARAPDAIPFREFRVATARSADRCRISSGAFTWEAS
jgi:hypothetical protein